jgi:hypothetical protein
MLDAHQMRDDTVVADQYAAAQNAIVPDKHATADARTGAQNDASRTMVLSLHSIRYQGNARAPEEPNIATARSERDRFFISATPKVRVGAKTHL